MEPQKAAKHASSAVFLSSRALDVVNIDSVLPPSIEAPPYSLCAVHLFLLPVASQASSLFRFPSLHSHYLGFPDQIRVLICRAPSDTTNRSTGGGPDRGRDETSVIGCESFFIQRGAGKRKGVARVGLSDLKVAPKDIKIWPRT